MSDSEEPPVKVPRVEAPEQLMDGDEEWLNEDILTDDDLQSSQDSNQNSTKINVIIEGSVPELKLNVQKGKPSREEVHKSDEIGLYFDQFVDSEAEPKVKSDCSDPGIRAATDTSKDDACQSTADLLRMLSEGVAENASEKNVTAAVKTVSAAESNERMFSSDEDIFEGVKLTATKITKSLYMKSDSKVKNEASIKTYSDSGESDPKRTAAHKKNQQPTTAKDRPARTQRASKSTTKNGLAPRTKTQQVEQKKEQVRGPQPVVKKLGTYRNVVIADEEALKEILADSESGSDEDGEESWDDRAEYSENEEDKNDRKEVKKDLELTDDSESFESDYTYNDVMLSSDSDDVEEMFSLDIRGERAGDYIPLLGEDAQHILEEEKLTAMNIVTDLRRSLADLDAQNRKQTEELEEARKRVRELSMLLKST